MRINNKLRQRLGAVLSSIGTLVSTPTHASAQTQPVVFTPVVAFIASNGLLTTVDTASDALAQPAGGLMAAPGTSPDVARLPIDGGNVEAIGAPPLSYDILQARGLYSLGHLGVASYDSQFRLKSVGEAPDRLFGDFVDTNIAFGRNGDHYGVTEFGVVYKLDSASHIVESLQITDEPVEVLSGQISRDGAGDLIVSYAGRVHVIASGGAGPAHAAAPSAAAIRHVDAGRAAKAAARRTITPPPPAKQFADAVAYYQTVESLRHRDNTIAL